MEERRQELAEALTREEGKTIARIARRSAARDQRHRVLRRRSAADHRRNDPVRAAAQLLLHGEAAGRAGRHHHAVELPRRDPGLEDGAGARLRQHGRLQAGEPDAADGRADRRDLRRVRASARRAEPRVRRRTRGRATRSSGTPRSRRCRSPDRTTSASASTRAAAARGIKCQCEMGGKNPIVILARRGSRSRGREHGAGGVRLDRPALHRDEPRRRRRLDRQRVRRAARRRARRRWSSATASIRRRNVGPSVDDKQLETVLELRRHRASGRGAGSSRGGDRLERRRPRPRFLRGAGDLRRRGRRTCGSRRRRSSARSCR